MQLSKPFTYISNYALTNRSKREFITDKKTGCVYYVAYRSKTNEKRRSGSSYQPNTEYMRLAIDPNLSRHRWADPLAMNEYKSLYLCTAARGFFVWRIKSLTWDTQPHAY